MNNTEPMVEDRYAKLICPACQQDNPVASSVCMWCGTPLPTTAAVAVTTANDGPTPFQDETVYPQPQYAPLYMPPYVQPQPADGVGQQPGVKQTPLWKRRPVQLMALLLIVCTLVLLAFIGVQALKPTPPKVVTQFISPLGISATLPGSDWAATADTLHPGDGSYKLTSASDNMQFVAVQSQDGTAALERAGNNDPTVFVPPVSRTNVNFHGYQAIRLEGLVYQSATSSSFSYHGVGYVFAFQSGAMSVAFFSPDSAWESSGRAAEEAIMQSVSFK